ncbi:Rossmann-like and DUF2520 domain-containing protein [Leminorella grimontii]|uniref:Rossmann-like and DUF2520 domain-containing protein n=1 Tax=Leminorella grimontii TaxID=82981 RepID=UPI0032205228
MNIGFIGAGKVGFALGSYFTTKGKSVAGYYSRSFQDAQAAARFTQSESFHSLPELIVACDTLFITVPDGEIGAVWREVAQHSLQDKIVCHCSGALSSEVFDGARPLGAYGYSLHPLLAISDKTHSAQALATACFTLEGNEARLGEMTRLVESLGNRVAVIDAANKARYHAACVTVSNLVIALAKVGSDLFSQCGFDDDFSTKAWNSLFLGNAENVCRVGVKDALTGPLERGDDATIRQHLEALGDGELREIYLLLSKQLLDVAREKHPQRDYSHTASHIEAELKK